jgi:SPX domain protein involved in polyphosphate accumulation
LERELKLVFPANKYTSIRAYLRGVAQEDQKFPNSVVSTINYDTKQFFFLDEKLNSDLIKRKVRLRWYSQGDKDIEQRSYLELKSKRGIFRSKQRKVITMSGTQLENTNLENPTLISILYEDFVSYNRKAGHLLPVLYSSYRRERFFTTDNKWRLAIDTNIQVNKINHMAFGKNHFSQRMPPLCVIEFKGTTTQLPEEYFFLINQDPLKKTFSKYSFCCYNV